MSTTSTDTIVAVATAAGRGGVGIVRLSGPLSGAIATTLAGPLPAPRVAALRDLRDSESAIVDRGLALWFPAPHSFTGEDVAELQAHGGPVLLDLLVKSACALGARIARPGEFSERAFLNQRLDLAQAEAVADLIDAGSEAALRAASRTLHGEFSARIDALTETLMALRADLEAALDFADEDVPWLNEAQLRERLATLAAALEAVLAAAAQGRRLRDGLTVAIVGQPNVGKSTLLNRLAGTEAAIVSPTAGTTRDVLREHLVIDGLPLTVLDTAGLRDTGDAIEQEGIRRAWAALENAELIVYLVEDAAGVRGEDHAFLARMPERVPKLLLRNKCDASGGAAGTRDEHGALRIAAATGAGIDALARAVHAIAGLDAEVGASFAARARHLDALRRAGSHVAQARRHDVRHPELIAEELRLAQAALDDIIGRTTTEDLLGRIFSQFCLGK